MTIDNLPHCSKWSKYCSSDGKRRSWTCSQLQWTA